MKLFPMKKLLFTGFCLFLIIFYGCKKSGSTKNTTKPATPLSFTGISASVNPVQQSKVADLTANASGSNLTYSWSASHGDLFGSGSTVMYSTAPCCVGTHTVTCVVSDGSSSSTKTLVMTVTQ